MIVMDKDSKKVLDRCFQRANTIYDKFASWNRLFFRGDWNEETREWEFTDVSKVTIPKSRMVQDLATISRQLNELKVIVDEFREEVKNT